MRVISGIAKGRALTAPEGLDTRPTADRIKESLFNMIAPDLYGACFLDLFAGSGSIGIEALSRGAESCVFVDSDRRAVRSILKNLEKTELLEKAETLPLDAETAIKRLAEANKCFDIIFMDPPYKEADLLIRGIVGHIGRLEILSPEGYVICEHGAGCRVDVSENIILIKKKSYGKMTAISFLRPK